MRNTFKILFGGILLFGIITCATMTLNYDADGADQYGFPFNFYAKVNGYDMGTNEGVTSIEFEALSLVYDLAFALLLSWLTMLIHNKFRCKKSIPKQ